MSCPWGQQFGMIPLKCLHQQTVHAFCQNREIPCQCRRLAGYIDDLSRLQLQCRHEELLAGAAPGRIHEENVKFLFFGGHVSHKAAGVIAEYFDVFCFVELRVDFRVLHRFGIQLHTEHLFAAVGGDDSDRTDAAVSIKDPLLSGEPGVVQRDVVEFLRLQRVDLVEGTGGDVKTND